MMIVRAFLLGGVLCLIGQLLIDKTALTPARILTGYVVAGVILGASGIYGALLRWGDEGAAVPLTGFGYLLVKGTREAVDKQGLLGALTGGAAAAAGGVSSAIVFALLAAIIFPAKDK